MSAEGMSVQDPLDYIDQDGKKIGSDGNNDGTRALVTDANDVRTIESATKNGQFVQLEQLSNIAGLRSIPNNTVLNETLDVIERGNKNGGLREESSIVAFDGDIYRGETGPMPTIEANRATAPARLPSIRLNGINDQLMPGIGESGGVSIHLHPTESLVSEDKMSYYSFSASIPTTGVDDAAWSSHRFGINIIVGRLGVNSNVTILPNGRVTDSRSIGAAFYLSGDLRPRFELTKSAIQNIINGVSK